MLYDASIPSVTAVSAPSYFSEQGMGFQTNGDGSPRMPAIFTYASCQGEPLVRRGHLQERREAELGASQPTGAQFEGDNPNNVPFYQAAIPYNPAQDAPITSVTYYFIVQGCSGCSGAVTTTPRPAIPAQKTGNGFLYFDIPIALESLPQLAQAPGTAGMMIETRVIAEDAAGNRYASGHQLGSNSSTCRRRS